MKFRLLIADDEQSIREGVAGFIRRHCPRWEVVGQAADGREALETALLTLPHAVLTDIEMPGLNGLEFLESLTGMLPETRLLVLSGYDQFAYAVQAMRLGVNDYLLKPLDTDKLTAILDRFADDLEADAAQRTLAQAAQVCDEESRAETVRNYLRAALSGMRLPPAPEETGLEDDGAVYGCALCTGFVGREELLPALLAPRLRGAGLHAATLLLGSPPALALVFWGNGTAGSNFLTISSVLTSVAVGSRRDHDLAVHFCIGSLVDEPDRLAHAWQQCTQVREAIFLDQAPMVMNYTDLLASRLQTAHMLPKDTTAALLQAVACGSRTEYARRIDELFDWFRRENICDAVFTRMSILGLCYNILETAAGQRKLIYNEFINFQAEIMAAGSRDLLRTLLDQFVQRQWQLRERQVPQEPTLAQKVDKIVRAHISDIEFSLGDVAAALFISPNYLRQLFKAETGQTFTEYLTACRMEYARVLLGNPALKVAEVAEQAGYADTRYFSVCFKKYFHQTPSEYRTAATPSGGG